MVRETWKTCANVGNMSLSSMLETHCTSCIAMLFFRMLVFGHENFFSFKTNVEMMCKATQALRREEAASSGAEHLSESECGQWEMEKTLFHLLVSRHGRVSFQLICISKVTHYCGCYLLRHGRRVCTVRWGWIWRSKRITSFQNTQENFPDWGLMWPHYGHGTELSVISAVIFSCSLNAPRAFPPICKTVLTKQNLHSLHFFF